MRSLAPSLDDHSGVPKVIVDEYESPHRTIHGLFSWPQLNGIAVLSFSGGGGMSDVDLRPCIRLTTTA